MTPKEKSIEIYNKFRNENSVMSANVRAKKQALILVDEIINELKEFYDEFGFSESRLKYWQEVKEEINKL